MMMVFSNEAGLDSRNSEAGIDHSGFDDLA